MSNDPAFSSNLPGASLYSTFLKTLRPRLVRLLEPIPWIPVDRDDAHGGFADARHIWKFVSAAAALGLAIEEFDDEPYRLQLAQLVRSSLVRWQYSLRGDGVPLDRRHRLDPWHASTCSSVVLLLSESSEFQSDSLLTDIALHVRWLSRRPYLASWKEAAFITAMADTSLLLRDNEFADDARNRLRRFIKMQTTEGWFPENGGPDFGFLSLVIDSLSRLLHVHHWEEVTEPLDRATRWLCNFIVDSSIPGGAVCSRGTHFISPCGLESMATHSQDVARALLHVRTRIEKCSNPRTRSLSDDMVSLLAVRLALTLNRSSHQTDTTTESSTPMNVPASRPESPASGLWTKETSSYRAIVNLKQGAAFQIIWRSSASELHDSGVAVIFSDSVRVSGRWSGHTHTEAMESLVSASGPFHHPRLLIEPDRFPITLRLARWFRSLKTNQPTTPVVPALPKRLGIRYALGHFKRELTFHDDSIEIRDLVETIRPSVAIICQLPFAGEPSPFRMPTDDHSYQQPLYFDGGQKVELRRTYRRGQLIECTRTLLK